MVSEERMAIDKEIDDYKQIVTNATSIRLLSELSKVEMVEAKKVEDLITSLTARVGTIEDKLKIVWKKFDALTPKDEVKPKSSKRVKTE